VEQGRTADSDSPTGSGPEIPAQGGSWTQADACTAGFFGYRLRFAHRHSMESIAATVRLG
jgi:hypothetical protein